MNRTTSFVVAAASVAVALATFVACQSSDDNPPTYQPKGGSAGTTGQGGAGGGTAGTGNGGTANGGTGNGGTSNGGGGGAGGGMTCSITGAEATVEAVANGTYQKPAGVHFTGIAQTESILAYSSKKKGSCLWAVFVKDPAKDIATMVFNYGDNMETLADGGYGDCPPNKVFEGVQPGDTLDITGTVSPYGATCDTDAGPQPPPQMQVQVTAECFKKTASGAAPAPVKVTDLDAIVNGDPKYQGLVVELDNVTVVPWEKDGGTSVVGPYGVIKLQGATKVLEVHDKFYYTAEGAPEFGALTTFNKIVGVVHLDFCTWAIQPTHLCAGAFDPKPTNCP